MEFKTQKLNMKKVFMLWLSIHLIGCVDEKQDLPTFVAEIEATQKPDIEPIPVMKPYEKFDYAASDLRDPFTVAVVDLNQNNKQAEEDVDGIRPDKHRRKEALEAYPLSELQFVGTLEKEGIWGLIRASDGIINRVKAGNYLGQNHGQILSISPTEITLKEIVSNGQGRFVERGSTLPIVEVN